MNPISSVYNWTFLQEPLYRWVIFLFALGFIGMAWGTLVSYMKV